MAMVFGVTSFCSMTPLAPKAYDVPGVLASLLPKVFLSDLQLLISNTVFATHFFYYFLPLGPSTALAPLSHLDEGIKRFHLPLSSITSWFSPETLPP